MITLVRATSAISSDGGNSAFTPAVDVTSANLFVMAVVGAISNPSTFDSSVNTFIPLTPSLVAGPDVGTQLFYCLNPTVSASHQFGYFQTAPFSPFPSIYVLAFSGVGTFAVEGSGTAANVAAGTLAVDPITFNPSGPRLIVTALYNNNASSPPSIDEGFTLGASQNQAPGQSYGGAIAYLIEGASSTLTPTWTTAGDIAATIWAAWNPAAAGTPVNLTIADVFEQTRITW